MERSVIRALVLLVALTAAGRAQELLNEDVKRTVDVSSHLAKVTAEVKLSNPGPAAAHSFLVALEPELAGHLAFLGVSMRPLQTMGVGALLSGEMSHTIASM